LHTNRYQSMPDEEVVALARHGQSDATDYLIRRYRRFVETKASRFFMFGSEREDVVQEGMVGLFKAISSFKDEDQHRFRPFAELCVTRQIVSAVNAAQNHKHAVLTNATSLNTPVRPGVQDVVLEDTVADTRDLPSKLVEDKDFRERMDQALNRGMSPIEQNVLRAYLIGCTYREIGEKLGVNAKAVDNVLQRAKQKARTALEQNKALS